MAFHLPRTLTLPSGMRATLRRTSQAALSAACSKDDAPLFSEVLALFDGEVECVAKGSALDVRDLQLADFHVLRTVLTKAGLVEETKIAIRCHNCNAHLEVQPSQGVETGPWEDGEANDPELDQTAPFDVPLEIAPITFARVRRADTVTLAPRTVRDTMPLFEALARDPFELDAEVVRAMGIKALGPLHTPGRIAAVLSRCDERAWGTVTDTFLAAHYPLRLATDVFCPSCKARNTVDAPERREFEFRTPLGPDEDELEDEERGEDEKLPALEDFVELAHEIAEPLISEIPGPKAELVVESGTPAVDDGGAPLLGSYVPPPPQDAPVPTQPPTVTIYYRTFEKIEREEGPFDWRGELRETIEHELEHHI
ncbi:MAG TPA: hypothetical protein VM580_10960 [Labilithrix sp.]|nr:hypothetical protein [Labilithrix sp.]